MKKLLTILPLLMALGYSTPATAGQDIAFRPGYPNFCTIDVRDWKKWQVAFEARFPRTASAGPAIEYLRSLGDSTYKTYFEEGYKSEKGRKKSFEIGPTTTHGQVLDCMQNNRISHSWYLGIVADDKGKIWQFRPTPYPDILKSVLLDVRLSPEYFEKTGLDFDFGYFRNKMDVVVALNKLFKPGTSERLIEATISKQSVYTQEKRPNSNGHTLYVRLSFNYMFGPRSLFIENPIAIWFDFNKSGKLIKIR